MTIQVTEPLLQCMSQVLAQCSLAAVHQSSPETGAGSDLGARLFPKQRLCTPVPNRVNKWSQIGAENQESSDCGRSSVVEHQLPKLSVEGSIPFARSNSLKVYSEHMGNGSFRRHG